MDSDKIFNLMNLMNNTRGIGQTSKVATLAFDTHSTVIVHNKCFADELRNTYPGLSVRHIGNDLRGYRNNVILDNSAQLALVHELYNKTLEIEQSTYYMVLTDENTKLKSELGSLKEELSRLQHEHDKLRDSLLCLVLTAHGVDD